VGGIFTKWILCVDFVQWGMLGIYFKTGFLGFVGVSLLGNFFEGTRWGCAGEIPTGIFFFIYIGETLWGIVQGETLWGFVRRRTCWGKFLFFLFTLNAIKHHDSSGSDKRTNETRHFPS